MILDESRRSSSLLWPEADRKASVTSSYEIVKKFIDHNR